MKHIKRIISMGLVLIITFLTSGCWNYREIDRLAIVGGVAIDKQKKDDKYKLTVEINNTEVGEKGGEVKPELYECEGKTIFEAARNLIVKIGRRAYWSHAKVVLLGKEIAEEDLSPVLDWLYRDSELRRDLKVLISKETQASDILKNNTGLESTVSFHLYFMSESQKDYGKFPDARLWQVVRNMQHSYTSILLPVVEVRKEKDKTITSIRGSAILNKNKVIGYLTPKETQDALWLSDKIKGGVFVANNVLGSDSDITFEIFGNKTKINVYDTSSSIGINISAKTTVAIAEITGGLNYTEDEIRKKIKLEAQKVLKTNLQNTLNKIQKEYKTDAFSFDSHVRIKRPGKWKKISSQWNDIFVDIPISINVDVIIKGSATASRPVKGEE